MSSLFSLFVRIFSSERHLLLIPFVILSLGLATLFCSYCIFTGMEQDFLKLVQTRVHLELRPKETYHFENLQDLELALKSVQGKIHSLDFRLQSQALLQHNSQAVGVLVQAYPGAYSKESRDYRPPIQISRHLAQILGAKPGDELNLIGPDGGHNSMLLVSVFEEHGLMEKKYSVEMNLDQAQAILFGEEIINLIQIKFKDYTFVNELPDNTVKSLKEFAHLSTWEDQHVETLKLFSTQRSIHFLLLLLMGVFCSVSIFSAFYLVFLRKKETFARLILLGLAQVKLKRMIRSTIQLWLLLSIVSGGIISKLVQLYLISFPLALPQSIFYSSTLPFHWNWQFFTLCSLSFFAIGHLALHQSARMTHHELG